MKNYDQIIQLGESGTTAIPVHDVKGDEQRTDTLLDIEEILRWMRPSSILGGRFGQAVGQLVFSKYHSSNLVQWLNLSMEIRYDSTRRYQLQALEIVC
jgi:hypothetical protein